MPRDGGIDLHAKNRVVVLRHAQEQGICQKRVPNQRPAILEPLSRHHGAIAGCVVASTSHGYWLVDGCMEAGSRVPRAKPAALQQYRGLQ